MVESDILRKKALLGHIKEFKFIGNISKISETKSQGPKASEEDDERATTLDRGSELFERAF